MPEAAFVIPHPYVDALACYREPMVALAARGWNIDLYTVMNRDNPPPSFLGPRIRLVPVSLTKLKTAQMVARLVLRRPKYDWVFSVPGWGLHYAGIAARLARIPAVCISDELHARSECRTEDERRWKEREIRAHRACAFTIALSSERADFIRDENGLGDVHPIFVVPNSSPGPSRRLASDFFQKKFGFGADTFVLLHAGSWWWRKDFSRIESVTAGWDKGLALVFHGRMKDAADAAPGPPNIYYSRQPLPYAELDRAVSSAHVGLALYDNSSVNHRLVGAAGGKIPLYMKNALPVIATRQPSFEWMEKERCGVLIDDLSEIGAAAGRIRAQYAEYSENARRAYDARFNFTKNFEPVIQRLEGAKRS